MPAPQLEVAPEPAAGGASLTLPLALLQEGGDRQAQLFLRLAITNHQATTVHPSKLVLSFSSPPLIADVAISLDFDILGGATKIWAFDTSDNVLLPYLTPTSVELRVFADGFSEPVRSTWSFLPQISPVANGGHPFPARAADLGPGEHWFGRSVGLRDGRGNGAQLQERCAEQPLSGDGPFAAGAWRGQPLPSSARRRGAASNPAP